MSKEDAREKFLRIAYKRRLINNDPIYLNILREKYVTFGKNELYFYNQIISYGYWVAVTDATAEFFLDSLLRKSVALQVRRYNESH